MTRNERPSGEISALNDLLGAGTWWGTTEYNTVRTRSGDFNVQEELFGYNISRLEKHESGTQIIGATDLVLRETSQKSDGTLSADDALTETVDTSTHPDRAVFSLVNGRGYDVYLTRLLIDGKPITRSRGANGSLCLDSLKRDDDIRRNGEVVRTIANDYIFDVTQVATIADRHYKLAGQKKHLYSVAIVGAAHFYEPGEWYTLTLGAAGTNEYIDATVECFAVEVSHTAGDIGQTRMICREVMESWAKTTLYTARLITGASPKRRSNQSNTLIVASSSFDGTYDYRCDGTADDVQIQAAIDYLAARGGGTVQKTDGIYTYAASIVMKDNVRVVGVGPATIDKPASASVTTMYDFGSVLGASLENCTIDGSGTSITFTTTGMEVINGNINCYLLNVIIQNYAFSCTTGTKYFYLFSTCMPIGCISKNNSVANTGTAATATSFYSCRNVSSCYSTGNTTSGGSSTTQSFTSCTNVSSCTSSGNSTVGVASHAYSFYLCTNVSSCTSSGNSTSGNSGQAGSFITCTNISSCSSVSNSTTGASARVYSFITCNRITVCNTTGNTSALAAEYGFYNCRSVQQCNSTDDAYPYTNPETTSYADAAGTAGLECADSAAGGYNS